MPEPPEFACVRRKFPPRPSRVWHGAGDEGRKTRGKRGVGKTAGFFFYALLYNGRAAKASTI